MTGAAMTETAVYPARPLVTWRTLEWWGIGLSLFLLSGAVFPLLGIADDNRLDDSERAALRAMSLPIYLLTLAMFARHPIQFAMAILRSWPLVLLVGLAWLSVLWSIDAATTLRRAFALTMSTLLAFALAVRFTPRQYLLLSALVLGACMVLSLVFLALVPHLAITPSDGTLRGVFVHKNVLGWAACVSVVASMALMADEAAGMRRLGYALVGPSLACLLLSTSATSIVATFAGLALLAFYRALVRKHGLARWVLVLVFLQVTALFLIGLSNFLVPLLDALGKDSTLTGRLPLWELIDEKIRLHPLIGYGYQAFWEDGNAQKWQIVDKILWEPPHAHNGLRETLLGLGLVGAVLLGVVLVRAFLQGAARHCAAPRDGWLWINLSFGVILFLNLTESIVLMQNDVLWIMSSAGIAMVGLRRSARAPGAYRP